MKNKEKSGSKGGSSEKLKSRPKCAPIALVEKVMEHGRDPLKKILIAKLKECKDHEHYKACAKNWGLIHVAKNQTHYRYHPEDSALVTPADLYASFVLVDMCSEGATWFESFLGEDKFALTCMKKLEMMKNDDTTYEAFMDFFKDVMEKIRRTPLDIEDLYALYKSFVKYWPAKSDKPKDLSDADKGGDETTMKTITKGLKTLLYDDEEDEEEDALDEKEIEKREKMRVKNGGAPSALVKTVMKHGLDPLRKNMLKKLEDPKSQQKFQSEALKWGIIRIANRKARFLYLDKDLKVSPAGIYATCISHKEGSDGALWLKTFPREDGSDAWACMRSFEEMRKESTSYEDFMIQFKDVMRIVKSAGLDNPSIEALEKCQKDYWDAKKNEPRNLSNKEKGGDGTIVSALKKGVKKLVDDDEEEAEANEGESS